MHDRLTGQKVVLSDADVQLILRFRKGRTVDPNVDPYAVSLILVSHILIVLRNLRDISYRRDNSIMSFVFEIKYIW